MTVLCFQSISDERPDLVDLMCGCVTMISGTLLECLSAIGPSGCLFVFFFVIVPFAKDDSKSFRPVALCPHFRDPCFIHFIYNLKKIMFLLSASSICLDLPKVKLMLERLS